MIASERTQNVIVVTVIMVAIVSSGLLVSNATYYGGSYSLAGTLNVTLLEVAVGNIDHTNILAARTGFNGIAYVLAEMEEPSFRMRLARQIDAIGVVL